MVAEWTLSGRSPINCLERVLVYVYEWFSQNLSGYRFWLLLGHSAWQPDTKMVRYRKLFNSLAANGINFEGIEQRKEAIVERDRKIKFFGAVQLDASVLSLVPETMPIRSSTYIVLIPEGKETSFPLADGWTGQRNADGSLIEIIAERKGIVFQRTGFFDDPEAGLVAVGSRDVLGNVLKQSG
jgi:hypothetical protein